MGLQIDECPGTVCAVSRGANVSYQVVFMPGFFIVLNCSVFTQLHLLILLLHTFPFLQSM